MLTSFASTDRQRQYDCAVVIPTIVRPSLLRAVRSVYRQQLKGRIQVLIGVDQNTGSGDTLNAIAAERPDFVDVDVLDPGYSTVQASGGLYSCTSGGSLRSVLTLLANSRHVTYLDDDNWIAPDHISNLLEAVNGYDWACCRRWFVDGRTLEPICIDEWESVGPDAGVFNAHFGGFVDPNCLIIDKIRCHDVVSEWALPIFSNGTGEDRRVFEALRARHQGRLTLRATAYYVHRDTDGMHSLRAEWMRSEGYVWSERRRLRMRLDEAMRIIHPRSPYDSVDVSPAVVDLQGWGGSDSPVFRDIMTLIRPTSIVEVGTWKGRSAIRMAEIARNLGLDALIVCVDTWLGSLHLLLSDEWRPQLRFRAGRPSIYDTFLANVMSCGFTERIIPFPQTSATAAAFLLRHGVQVDLVHIDASREEADVLSDCRVWWKLLRPGGMLMGDEYMQAWTGVVRAATVFSREVGVPLQVGGSPPHQKWLLQKQAQQP